MMTHRQFHTIIAALTVLVVGLGAANWYLKPEGAVAWAIGMASMPVIWGIVTYLLRRRPLAEYGEAERRFFIASVASAGLILAGAMGIQLFGAISEVELELTRRVWGVAVGVFLIVIGNVMPKILTPLAALRCEAKRAQSLQRFAGWSFLLAGLGYVAAWLILPVNHADIVATLSCLAAVVAVAVRCGWVFTVSRNASAR